MPLYDIVNVSQAACASPVLSVFKVHVIASSQAAKPAKQRHRTAPTRHASIECDHWAPEKKCDFPAALPTDTMPAAAAAAAFRAPSAGAAYC